MKSYIVIFFTFYATFISCHIENNKSVGYVNEKNEIVVNSHIALERVLKYLGQKKIENLKINDIKIHQVSTIGDKTITSYFIQFSDDSSNQKLAKYVFLHKDQFYFYEDIQKEWKIKFDEINTTFFSSYYLIKGSIIEGCTPNIASMENELFWITGTKLVCEPDSPCKSEQIVVI